MSGHLEQIRLDSYKPLRELVCEHIRDAIINGVFAPGERLMEIQMADEMGVSRTPVREAIRKLEMEGFVVMIPRRGTYVSNMSIRDINDVYEIRISLDTLAAGLAAERISDEELEELQRLLVKVGNAIEENDMAKVVAGADYRDPGRIHALSRPAERHPGGTPPPGGKHCGPECGKESGSGTHPSGKCGADADDCHVGAEGRRGAAEPPGG